MWRLRYRLIHFLAGVLAVVGSAAGQGSPGLISDPMSTVQTRSFCGELQVLSYPSLSRAAAAVLEGCDGAEEPSRRALCSTLRGLQRMSVQKGELEQSLLAARELYRETRDALGVTTASLILADAAHARGSAAEADRYLAEAASSLSELDADRSTVPPLTWRLFPLVYEIPLRLIEAGEAAGKDSRSLVIQTAAASVGSLRAASLGCQGKYVESETAAEQALALIASAPNLTDPSRLYELVGWLWERRGDDVKATERYEIALARVLEAGHPLQVLSVTLRLVDVLTRRDRLPEAHSVVSRALDTAKLDPGARALLLMEQGVLHARSGDLEPMDDSIRAVIELASREGEPRTQVGALMMGGAKLHTLGYDQQAAAVLETALPMLLRLSDQQVPAIHEKLRFLLVTVYSTLGLRDSIEHHLSELELLVAASGRRGILNVARWVANTVPDDPDASRSLVETFASLGVSAEVAEQLQHVAGFADRIGATETHEEMLEVLSDHDDPESPLSPQIGVLRSMIEGGEQGILEGARELLGDPSAGGRKPRLEEARSLAKLAGVEASLGDLDLAASQAREAVSVLESFLAQNDVDAIASAIVDAGGHEIFGAAALVLSRVNVEEAFGYAERGRALTLRRSLATSRSLRVRPGAEEALVLERIASAEASAPDSSQLEALRKEYQRLRLEAELARSAAAERAAVDPPSVETLRRDVLGDDTTLVAYLELRGNLFAWIVSPTSVEVTAVQMLEPDVFAGDVDRLSRGTRSSEEPATGGGTLRRRRAAQAVQSAEALYDSLIAPIEKWLEGRRLVILPTGSLHTVPFAGLRNGRTGRYLIEDYALSFAPSAAALVRSAPRGAPEKTAALVIGDALTSRARLGGARREAQAVADLLGAEPVLGKEATEGRFYEMAPNARLLHIATHGEYFEGSPYFNRLLLSREPAHDGALAVHEILDRVDLTGTDLVVLSACDTSAGSVSRGDDMVSLAQSFLLAGSRSVISTLWRVSDRASADLMVAFYSELLSGQKPAAEALRAAQLEMLSRQETAAPYFWAGYLLSGASDTVLPAKWLWEDRRRPSD